MSSLKFYSKTSLAVLEKYPTPNHILNADKDELISLIRENSRRGKKWSTEKYELSITKAKEFVPLSVVNSANIAMLDLYISMIRDLEKNQEKVMEAIHALIAEDLSKDVPVLALTLELLQSIPGIGLLSAVTIIAEIGNFSNFSKPDQLVAYFGIDPSVKQSGEFNGTKNKMSKRGPKLLRRVLYIIALANIRTKRDKTSNNPVLLEFYKSKCQSKPKKVALGAVMHKLVKIIFAVLRDRKPFELRTPQEHAKILADKRTVA